MTSLQGPDLARYIIKRHDDLSSKRSSWDGFWQDLANYVMPRKANINQSTSAPTADNETQLFDATAVQANMILANGQLSWMTPAESRWFAFDPPAQFKGFDPIEQFYRRCTEIAVIELARSNFYAEIHELYLDRGAFGTAVLWCEEGKRSALNFRKFDVGTFSIAEDDEGYVDTLSRELELTARQAMQWFGRESLSETIVKAFDEEASSQKDKCFKFIHQTFPRAADEIDLNKRDGTNMPIASIYVEKAKQRTVRVSGYIEQPFFCTRYLKWVSSEPYGWSPSWMALPEARQLNFLEKQMDALAELTAFPRFLIPDTHEGEVDFRASGVTYYDPANPNAIPREWATGGKYDVGKDRAQIKRQAINDAFHVDLFKMFANLDKTMTAREVTERSSEKLIQFSPTFARMTGELFNPLLRRVFSVLYRLRMLPPVPDELKVVDATGAYMPEPEVTYSSRIALAIKSLENASFSHTIELLTPMFQLAPQVADNFNMDIIARDAARNAGLPARWLQEAEAVAQIREQRQAEMQKQQQQAEAAQMAESASKVGSIKNDSVAGRMISEAMPT